MAVVVAYFFSLLFFGLLPLTAFPRALFALVYSHIILFTFLCLFLFFFCPVYMGFNFRFRESFLFYFCCLRLSFLGGLIHVVS